MFFMFFRVFCTESLIIVAARLHGHQVGLCLIRQMHTQFNSIHVPVH